MGYTNSPLVSYVKISPNRTVGRNHKIDTITIHCVAGQCSVETLGDIFAPESREASSNYGIGPDGRIGMYCEEKDRSWCTGSRSNDHRAITIEVASDTKHPYAVKDKAYKALIDLVTDICKRNNIKELKWKADKSLIGQVDKQNMTVHRWFQDTDCPGDYLYSRHAKIAAEVNERLKGDSPMTAQEKKEFDALKTTVSKLQKQVDEVSVKYDTVKSCPDYAQPTIQKLVDKGILKGDGNGNLKLTEQMIRILVILDRAGMFA